MKYLQLGKTDLMVSRICFGCWQLSPKFWGDVPVEAWQGAVRKAVDLGINFIDTADAYGDGYAEEMLGDLVKREGLRERLVVATKFYWNFERDPRIPDTRHDYILRACEASLKRLKTDRIDLYQIHAWDPLTRPDEVAAALGRLKKEGKIRWVGVSNLNADQMRLYLRHLDVECLQPQYSAITREPEARELPFCLEHRIGVIAYSSLAKGLLTGKYTAGHKFGDHRDDQSRYRGRSLERIQQGVAALKPIADRHGLTFTQLALRWVLTHPALTSAIVGIKTPEQIETAAPAADAALPIRDWHEMAGIIGVAVKEADALASK